MKKVKIFFSLLIVLLGVCGCNKNDNETKTANIYTTIYPLTYVMEKLYGENTPLTFTNIKLDYDCIGGYQYIADTQEYVQGRCSANKPSKVKATKKSVKHYVQMRSIMEYDDGTVEYSSWSTKKTIKIKK